MLTTCSEKIVWQTDLKGLDTNMKAGGLRRTLQAEGPLPDVGKLSCVVCKAGEHRKP